jgi:hypothetical protein
VLVPHGRLDASIIVDGRERLSMAILPGCPPPPAPTHLYRFLSSERFVRKARWRGTRLLPYIVDFIFFADSYNVVLLVR